MKYIFCALMICVFLTSTFAASQYDVIPANLKVSTKIAIIGRICEKIVEDNKVEFLGQGKWHHTFLLEKLADQDLKLMASHQNPELDNWEAAFDWDKKVNISEPDVRNESRMKIEHVMVRKLRTIRALMESMVQNNELVFKSNAKSLYTAAYLTIDDIIVKILSVDTTKEIMQ